MYGMKTLTQKAFTLVELLIVIGIIGILAVTLLVNLNPAETQKKARDAKRLKDAGTIEAVLVQVLNDGLLNNTPVRTSASAGSNQTQPCTSNWLSNNTNICAYIKSVPTDPQNNRQVTVVTGISGAGNVTTGNGTAIYRATITNGEYEVNVRQESSSNASKITGDGGNSTQWYELFSNSNSLMTN